MHRSSDTIATIAAALAKAQVELTKQRSRSLPPSDRLSRARRIAPSAMPRCRAGWTLSGKVLAGMRSRRSSRRVLIRKPAYCASRPSLRTRLGNGSRPNGRSARSPISPQRSAWELPSPTRGGTAFSRWSGSPEKMMSMRQTSVRPPIPRRSCRDGMIAYNRMGKLRQHKGQLLATGRFQALQQGPFSERSYRQAFVGA